MRGRMDDGTVMFAGRKGQVVGGILVLWAISLSGSTQAEAVTYHLRAQSSARATQYMRSDGTLAAPRIWAQSLTLSAFNLRGNAQNDVSARISLRYRTDFSLSRGLREDHRFDGRFNDLSLDLAYIRWRPNKSLEIVAGRQWVSSAVGFTDIDGVLVSYRHQDGDLRPYVSASVGRNVARGWTPFDPGAWDMQGLPANQGGIQTGGQHLVGTARAGVKAQKGHRVEVAAEQFQRPGLGSPVQVRRLGGVGTLSPRENLTLTASGSVHGALRGMDRFQVHAFYRRATTDVSFGFDHRQPIFDPGSIFNLFGAQPYRSGYGRVGKEFAERMHRVEVRAWGRAYYQKAPGRWDLGDGQALGTAIAGRHRNFFGLPLETTWQVSGQQFTDASGGGQYLGDLHLRVPTGVNGVYLTGRLLGLLARPAREDRAVAAAGSAHLGAEVDVGGIGQLLLSMEGRVGSTTRANTALFALFEVETWR